MTGKCQGACNARAGTLFLRLPAALCFLGFFLTLPQSAGAQSGLVSGDDLTVLGVDGTALDPDTEIKGFTVFGSTQAAYAGAVVGRGNVVVNGVLSVSSGAYFMGNSTFTAAGKIFINDGAAGRVLGKNPGGWLEWAVGGDNLGNHTATQILQMGAYGISSSSGINSGRYQIGGLSVMEWLAGSASFGAGYYAGRVNTGSYNTFIGRSAGHYNTTGAWNTFVGSYAGYYNTNGYDNSFIGYATGLYNATGVANTFIGSSAGGSNTIGSGNTSVGNYAGFVTTTGSSNTIVGTLAGYYSVAAERNVFVGYYAGYRNTSGSRGTFVGESAGYNNTTGNWNSFFGADAGYYNTTGEANAFFGRRSGQSNTGSGNTFLGYYAGYSNSTAWDNTFVGGYAGNYNTTGEDNCYLGAAAGYYNAGAANLLVGRRAGFGVLGSTFFSSSTVAGDRAGYSLTTGSDNLFLGSDAGYNVTTGTGNIVIGYIQDTSAPGASNEINIGGVYKGNISSGTATIPKIAVQAADSGITLAAADFGKTITVNSASARIVNLPSVTAADIGATVTVVKLGAGQVSVKAAAATYIINSTSGGTIYNNVVSPPYAEITLRLVTATLWTVISAHGTWTVT